MKRLTYLIPITKLHGFDFKACKQKIRLDPDQLSVSIYCWIQRSIACLLSELIFSMLTRFLIIFFYVHMFVLQARVFQMCLQDL